MLKIIQCVNITGYSKMTKPSCDILTWHSELHLHWFAARFYCQSKGEDLADDVIVKHNLRLCMDPSVSGDFWLGLYRISWESEGRPYFLSYYSFYTLPSE